MKTQKQNPISEKNDDKGNPVRLNTVYFVLRLFPFIFALISIILVLLAFAASQNSKEQSSKDMILAVGLSTGIFSLLASIYTAFRAASLSYARPFTMRIAVVGPPNSGKTTLLTMIYRELSVNQDSSVHFMPYGTETIEFISRNIERLSNGNWPLPTLPGILFPFRARASVRKGLISKEFIIEAGDYAGEHMEEFLPEEVGFLHKSDYFQYVLDADAIFFILDGRRLYEGGRSAQVAVDEIFTAAQIYLSSKGRGPGAVSQVPAALVITKSDLINRYDSEYHVVFDRIEKLQSLLSINFRKTMVFFVSATGKLDDSGAIPDTLRPDQVCEPLKFALLSLANVDYRPLYDGQ